MKTQPRFEVHDDDGALRKFYIRKEAEQYLNGKCGLRLVVQPRLKKEKQVASIKSVGAEAALY